MPSLTSSLLPTRRRIVGLAKLTLLLLVAMPHFAHAQGGGGGGGGGRRGGAAAAGAGPGFAAAGAATGANTGGGRRGGAAGGAFGVRGGRGGPVGAAGTDTGGGITTVVGNNPNGNPGNPNGAVGNGGGTPGGPADVVYNPADAIPDPEVFITVNMPGNSAQEVLDWLQQNTGKIIIQGQNLPPMRIIFSTETGKNNALPRKDVIRAVETLLSLNGIVLIPMGDKYLQAETADNIPGKNVPIIDGAQLLSMDPDGLIYGEFFDLQYLAPDAAVARITPFISAHGTADSVGLAKDSTIFVADTVQNLQNITKILSHFDRPVNSEDEIIYRTLTNASAQTVVTNLTTLVAGPLSKYFSTATSGDAGTITSIAADTRTNSVIVVTNKGNHAMVKQLLDQMDIDQEPSTKTEVFSLKQANATNATAVLQSIVTGVQTTTGVRGGGAGGGGAGGAGVPTASATRDQQFSPYVTIVSDTRSNAIVVYGTPSDLKQIGSLIDQLDVILPQVHIDAVVTEVILTKDQATGLSAFNIDYGYTAANGTTTPNAAIGGSKTYSTATTQGGLAAPAFTISGVLTNWDLNTVFNVERQNTNVKVLSNPSITVTHNQSGYINDGERIPTLSSSTTNLNAAQGTVTETVSYTNVSISLNVTPYIGKDGTVYMNITQSVENVVSEVPINGNNQPVIGTRNIQSWVSVHDGDVLVLGGLRQRQVSSSHGVMFLLGELPVIGGLFQPDSYDSTQSELIVFIKPTIVKGETTTDQLAKELPTNSNADAISLDYLRTQDLNGNKIEQGTTMENNPDEPKGPGPDHAPSSTSPVDNTAPVPATLAPTAPGSVTTTSTDTSTPATITPASTPSSTPATTTQLTPSFGGFNK